MIKHSRIVASYTMANGMETWAPPESNLFLPETDMEVALRMVSIKNKEEEILLFAPLAIKLLNATFPTGLPQEEEIPETDR